MDTSKKKHVCKACGREYDACDVCDIKAHIAWRVAACCKEHYDAYMTLWKFDAGEVDKKEAKEVLEQLGAGDWVNSPVKELIDKILATEEKVHEQVAVEKQEQPAITKEAHEEKKAQKYNAFTHKF